MRKTGNPFELFFKVNQALAHAGVTHKKREDPDPVECTQEKFFAVWFISHSQHASYLNILNCTKCSVKRNKEFNVNTYHR